MQWLRLKTKIKCSRSRPTKSRSKFGKGAIMKCGDGGHDLNTSRLPLFPRALCRSMRRWGSAAFRGVASSRCTVLSPAAKRRLALQILAEARALGGVVAFIDAEHALDPVVCRAPGRGYRRGAHLPARHGRAGAWRSRDALVRSGAPSTASVVDSVAALAPKSRNRGRHGRRAAPAFRPA